MIVYTVVDALSHNFPLGVELEVFIRREEAERFVEEVRGEDPELASYVRIEERERAAMRWLERYLTQGSPRLQHFADVTASLATLLPPHGHLDLH